MTKKSSNFAQKVGQEIYSVVWLAINRPIIFILTIIIAVSIVGFVCHQ